MTKTEIANNALALLGEAQLIASWDENTVTANAIRLHYDRVRRSLIRGHEWNFAKARAVVEVSDTEPLFGWAYAYDLPDDCLNVSAVNGLSDNYEIEGRVLLTDLAESINLNYVKDEEDTTLFDSIFSDLLIYKLAAAVCMQITHDPQKKLSLEAEAMGIRLEAEFENAVEDKVIYESDLTRIKSQRYAH